MRLSVREELVNRPTLLVFRIQKANTNNVKRRRMNTGVHHVATAVFQEEHHIVLTIL